MNSDCADTSITNWFGMTAREPYKGKKERKKKKRLERNRKNMKERLKTSGRHKEYDIGKKCQEDLILGRQVFKWSLEPSCFDFQLKNCMATSYSV